MTEYTLSPGPPPYSVTHVPKSAAAPFPIPSPSPGEQRRPRSEGEAARRRRRRRRRAWQQHGAEPPTGDRPPRGGHAAAPHHFCSSFQGEEAEAGAAARAKPPRGRPRRDPFASALQRYENVHVEQLCEGLLLCSCWNSCSACENDYVVCNPATQEWTVLPPVVFPAQECSHPWKKGIPMTYLGFEFAVPSRFVVFATPYNADRLPGQMAIYSSETGQWSYVQSKWSSATHVDCSRRTHVFLNGTMHLATLCNSIIPTVDVEGKVWKEIQMPVDWASSNIVLTGQSQGRLYAWQLDYCDDSELDIWVLEDYGTGKWTLKHTVNVSELFGRHCRKDGDFYQMFAIHPDCNVIFLTNQKKMTVSYDMDNQKVHVICNEFMIGLPYIPCFAELPSAGH
uniref:F-box associated beta-propeller type 1 domain-containing protein n=1 Tax=Aegilops tauschii TaxID=37682 RepID=M8C0N0_AEGTA